MPFSDVADYSYEMFREFAAHGAQLRKEQIWKGETRIPDEIFLDNVVFHRVNTEGITSCRPLFTHSYRRELQDVRLSIDRCTATYV